MISVDTNVLVRIVTNDDPAQAKLAASAVAENPVFVPKTVLLEMEWVLRRAYDLEPPAILKAFRGILGLRNVVAEDPLAVALALELYENGLDFADALHLASSGEARKFLTFDEKLGKQARGLQGIPVELISAKGT